MLFNKKPKGLEDKNKHKNPDNIKKTKKTKQVSPSKIKVTPDKKCKKDENAYTYRNSCYNNTQPIDLHKSKDKQGWKMPVKKAHDHKNKLLTTSPVFFEKSTSNSKKKSKDKSRERSTSRLYTNRSNLYEKQKQLKNVSKRLYTQTKETTKKKSSEKSKSKSRTKLQNTDRDISPIRDLKKTKQFNVADRQVKFRKSENNENNKKSIKKKVKNRMKVDQLYEYPQTQRARPQKEEPKVKLKKKVPEIKTQFSERRHSFFDENLWKKLQQGQVSVKKVQPSPFLHIKSNFQYKAEGGQVQLSSRSQIKTYEEGNWQSTSRAKELERFKRQQQQKWSKMLEELQNLKSQKQVPEKIDELIKQLNANYSSLQAEAENFMRTSSREQSKREESEIFKSKDQLINVEESSSAERQAKPLEIQVIHGVEQDKHIQIAVTTPIEPLVSILEYEIPIKIELQEHSVKQPNPVETIEAVVPTEKAVSEQISAQIKDVQVKKSHTISLNTDFFDFFQNKKKLKLQILNNESPSQENQSKNVILHQQINLRQNSDHKQSDKDLLKELDFIDGPSEYIQVLSFTKQHKTEFQTEMEKLRQIQSQQLMAPLEGRSRFENEMQMHEQLDSESILLHEDPKKQNLDILARQIETSLVLQFCTTILRSKQILHNFLTTYSELVDANLIKTDNYELEIDRPSVPSSNEYILQLVFRLLDHIETNHKEFMMNQIKIPFQCKPIEILRFVRCADEDQISMESESSQNNENKLVMPFFGLQNIQYFQKEVLRNQYYIPNYFSFNHCIYDHFNDIFDELRPYGHKGKAMFSLQLSHPLTDFQKIKNNILDKFEHTLNEKYYEEPLNEDKFCNQEGIFQMTYFTAMDVIEEIFEFEALVLLQVLNKQNTGHNFV